MFKCQGILPTPIKTYNNNKFPIILGYITEKISMHYNNYTNAIITNNLYIYIDIYIYIYIYIYINYIYRHRK